MILFKGFVPTRNKQCTQKFKDRTDLYTYDQVKSLPEFAGILAEDTVLIDVDDFEQSELLFKIVQSRGLKCKVMKTTRGKHFYFKNDVDHPLETCKTHAKLAIGLTVDIKLGRKNSYAVLKFNDVEREVIYGGDDVDVVPKWLFPIKTNLEFMDMESGDGRNQSLFNYILTLQSEDFTIEEARETIRIINEYVMKQPLSNRELEVILRDDAFQKPIFFKGSSFLFDKFAVYIKNNNHVIKLNGQLHIYDDGVYTRESDKIEAAMIKHISSLNKTRRKEVLAYLSLIVPTHRQQSNPNLIAFNNGLYDFTKNTLSPFTPDVILTNKIPWDYNQAAGGTEGATLVDQTLNKLACHDPEIRALLEECVGSCLYPFNNLEGGKAFILTGDGANGKSTFIDMIKTMLGDENITSLDLKELSEKFQNAELSGKLANLGDDISSEFIPNVAIFKKLVTGERMQAQRKGQDPFEFNNYSKLLFSANNIPKLGGAKEGYALTRRLVIIPFNARFTVNDSDYNPNIKRDLRESEAVEYLILLAIAGLRRVLENGAYTKSMKVQNELDEFEISNNGVYAFVKECECEGSQIELQPTSKIYQAYCEFCNLNGLKPFSNIEFSRQICKILSLETDSKGYQGGKCRVFIKKKHT